MTNGTEVRQENCQRCGVPMSLNSTTAGAERCDACLYETASAAIEKRAKEILALVDIDDDQTPGMLEDLDTETIRTLCSTARKYSANNDDAVAGKLLDAAWTIIESVI